jgi:hypothetical protein
MGVLFAVVHLLLERLGLLLVGERKTCLTFFKFEAVKEDAILVVGKSVVYLLVPDDATVGRRDVHQLDPEGVAHKIVGQYCCALQSCVCPVVPVRVGNVQLGDSDSMDLVR